MHRARAIDSGCRTRLAAQGHAAGHRCLPTWTTRRQGREGEWVLALQPYPPPTDLRRAADSFTGREAPAPGPGGPVTFRLADHARLEPGRPVLHYRHRRAVVYCHPDDVDGYTAAVLGVLASHVTVLAGSLADIPSVKFSLAARDDLPETLQPAACFMHGPTAVIRVCADVLSPGLAEAASCLATQHLARLHGFPVAALGHRCPARLLCPGTFDYGTWDAREGWAGRSPGDSGRMAISRDPGETAGGQAASSVSGRCRL